MLSKTEKDIMSTKKQRVEPTQQEIKEDKVTFSSFLRGIQQVLNRIFTVSTLFVIFKYLAFFGFTAISAILSVNMFSRLSNQPVERFALITVAITLEFFKIFSIVRGNTLWRLKLKAQATRAYAMYTILALVAIMASYGFTLTVVNRNIQISNTSIVQTQIENSRSIQSQYAETLKSIEASIQANQARLAALPVDFTSAAQSLNTTIAKLQAQQADIQAKLAAEKANEATLSAQALEATKTATTTTSMFKLMADGFKWLVPSLDENSLMLFLLLLISIIIELGIISTSPAIPIEPQYLKHFLNDASAHRAEELMHYGKKKKEVSRDLSIAGRIAQRWMAWKSDVTTVLHPELQKEATELAVLPAPTKPKSLKFEPTETTVIGSVPVRKKVAIAPPVETVLEAPAPVAATIVEPEPEPPAPASEPVAEKKEPEAVKEEVKAEEEVPVRVPVAKAVGQQGAESHIYRFGKTTETVRDMFENFVHKLFKGDIDGSLDSPEHAAIAANISPALSSTFTNRLMEIRGSRGVPLIEKRADGKYYRNYPEGYIISYATTEMSRERK